MNETIFQVPRATGTHADVLLAVGLADLLQQATDEPVQLRARGALYEVVARLPEDWPQRLPTDAGYQYLRPKASAAVPAVVPADRVLDYETERDRVRRWRDLQQSAKGKENDPALREQLDLLKPRDDWRHWQVLNTLQGDDNTNKVLVALAEMSPEQARALIARALEALHAGRPTGVTWKVSSVQLFAPNAAKGYARLKPDSTDRNDKTKEAWVDPFAEWLRYRGYFLATCPFFTGSKSEGIRILTPQPADIAVRSLQTVVGELRRAAVYGAEPKLDALAVLALARTLIRHSELYAQVGAADEQVEELFALFGRTPASIISGVAITHYVSLGQARAVAQVGELALPDWFPMRTPEDARAWLAILEEHRRVLASLRDDRSDEIGLLVDYRRFLQRRGRAALDALVEFMGAYGAFVLRAREMRRRVAQFTTEHFRALVRGMMGEYLKILDDPGFQAVAAAVRNATVSAQALKAQGRTDYREIRYDLLPEIRRRRSLPDGHAFMETIAEFIASYNYENARRREMKVWAPRNVTTEELRAFAALVEEHSAPLVGALLAAYGSCREPREPEPSGTDTEPAAGESDTDAADGTEGE